MKNRFNLGDEVYTQSFGNPVKGTIIAIFTGMTFVEQNLIRSGHARIKDDKIVINGDYSWFKKNEDWPLEPVYYLSIESPTRPISYDEYCELYNIIKTDDTFKLYLQSVKPVTVLAHPEFDLISVEDLLKV